MRAIVPLSDELQRALLTRPGVGGPAVVVGPSLSEFRRICDKVGLIEVASSAALSIPASVVVKGIARPPLPRLPVYVKVATSMYAGRPAGRPVRVDDPAAYTRVLETMTRLGDAVVVQSREIDGRQWRYDFVRTPRWTDARASVQLSDHPYRVGQSTVLEFCPMPARLAKLKRSRCSTKSGITVPARSSG